MKKFILIFITILSFGKIVNGQQADLVILANPNVTPNPVNRGITITVTFSVKNIGNAVAGISKTGIYISPDPTLDNAVLLKKISLESLAVDSCSNNIQFKTPIPYFVGGGSYYILINLNDDLSINESNTANNSISIPITINYDAWAAQNIPYPIIFIHGLNSDDSVWDDMINDLKNTYGWSYGGRMDFCLNQDNDLTTSDAASDYEDWTNESDLQKDDYFTVNFDVDNYGNAHGTNIESNQSAIVKQGLAIRDAIIHVMHVTGRDKVILVGHSMGGLAAREYLQNPTIWEAPNTNHHVAKLVTIGTPNGGCNGTSFGIVIDARSEAVRDLRTSYYYSGNHGVYLFGGQEDLSYMNDMLLHDFYNADVNCDGAIGESIIGLNNKSYPTDVDYSCIIGNGSDLGADGDPFKSGDGIVSVQSANLNNYLPVQADTFMVTQPLLDMGIWHNELPQQFSSFIKAIDEPVGSHFAYEVYSGKSYYGIISKQSDESYYITDYDYYKIYLSSNGSLNLKVYNIPISQFKINVFNSSLTSVYSETINGKSYVNLNTPSLIAGNYYISLSGTPTSSSWQYPYAFKFTYNPPIASYCSGTTTLTASSGTFDDGSGSSNYNNNSDCKWKIQPSGATSITLNFSAFDVSNTGDTIYVYNGATTASPVLLKWTGNTLPTNVTSTGGTMLIRFSTDASTTAAGWTANYTSIVVPTYCNGTTTLTSVSGSFSDCSGASDYGNNSNCSWLINPPGAYSITLTFNHFNTEAVNDVVNVYDGNDNTALLLGSYSGNTIPSSITSTGGAMFLEFITNDTITASGWDASYTSEVPFSTNGIVKYEYWFDDNYAARVIKPIMLANKYNLNSSFLTNGLAVGLHQLNIRFLDNSGYWSSIISQFFYKNPVLPTADKKMIKYEYWFDDNYLARVQQTINPTATYDLLSGLDASAIAQGLHTFNVRFKDNAGLWSSVLSQFFYRNAITNGVSNKIKAYRYWFDMASNNMNSVTLSTPVNPLDLITEINTCNLPLGSHNLNIQFLDILGYWSSVLTNAFTKTTQTYPSITINGSATICIGDSVEISASAGSSYLWSNGESTQNIFVSTPGTYSVSVDNGYDCILPSSNSAIVSTFPSHNGLTIIQHIDSLKSPYASQNQWYFLGNPNPIDAGNFYICSQSGSYFVVGKDVNGCSAISDTTFFNCITTGINNGQILGNISIYPNPANDFLFIDFQDYHTNSNTKFEMYNINGKLIKSVKIEGKLTKVLISDLSYGVYITKVINDDGMVVKQIIKE